MTAFSKLFNTTKYADIDGQLEDPMSTKDYNYHR